MGAAPQRQQDPEWQGDHYAHHRQHQGQHQAAPAVGFHHLQTGPAVDQHEGDDREHQQGKERQPALARGARPDQQRQQHGQTGEGQIDAPILVGRVKAVEVLPQAALDKDPAGPALGAVGTAAPLPVGGEDSPVQRRPEQWQQQVGQHKGQQAVPPVGEEVLPDPGDQPPAMIGRRQRLLQLVHKHDSSLALDQRHPAVVDVHQD